MKNPRVAICILNWNGAQHTLQCIDSIMRADYRNHTIIVADNASADDSVAQIRCAYPDIQIVCNTQNLGYAAGNRAAVEKALQDPAIELVWILNNDAQLATATTLTALVDACNQYPQPAIFGNIILLDNANCAPGRMRTFNYLDIHNQPILENTCVRVEDLLNDPAPLIQTLSVSGASMLIPADIIRKHGFIDDSFFLYYEDADYCVRLRRAGVAVVLVKNSVVAHLHGSAAKKRTTISPVIHYYQLRSRIVFHRRHSERRKFWYVTVRGLVGALLWLLLVPVRGMEALNSSRFAFLAVRDALTNRLGKTFAPEDWLPHQEK